MFIHLKIETIIYLFVKSTEKEKREGKFLFLFLFPELSLFYFIFRFNYDLFDLILTFFFDKQNYIYKINVVEIKLSVFST